MPESSAREVDGTFHRGLGGLGKIMSCVVE